VRFNSYTLPKMVYIAMKIAAAVLLFASVASANNNSEEARWLVQTSLWGTLSWLEGSSVSSMVASYGESGGRIFYYLPVNMEFKGALTLSEAAVDPSQFDGARCGPDGDLDPEDPRCAKLTLSGTMTPVDDDTKQFGLDTLFATHPQMESWPADHGFTVYEMHIESLWMIASFGGGGSVDVDDFLAAEPVHHAVKGFPTRRNLEDPATVTGRPNFGKDAAGHARWLVAKSLWTTVSTVSTREDGQAFGNIRSMVDGECFLGGSGLPYFYLPSPDPTAIDVEADSQIVLSFTEAALPQLVGEDGVSCGGMDAEDPTCAKIAISGRAIPLEDDQIPKAEASFGAQHPNAKWLSQGGAHTGGKYYTIQIDSFEFFRSYGGLAHLSVEDYTNWTPDPSKFEGEEACESTGMHEHGNGEGMHEHGNGEGMHEHGNGEGMHDHGHGEGMHDHGHDGYEHGHDDHEDGYAEYAELMKKDKDCKEFSMYSFMYGTMFGFLLWGPTIALVVYHKSCGKGRSHKYDTESDEEYEPVVKGITA